MNTQNSKDTKPTHYIRELMGYGETTYEPSHIWYYRLGGEVHKPKAILSTVKKNKYQSYRFDEFKKADDRAEPQRSSLLRSLREEVLGDLRSNLAIYRKYACELREYRLLDEAGQQAHDKKSFCSNIHMSMSLKYSHLYNDFAHLVLIDDLLSFQTDLFA